MALLIDTSVFIAWERGTLAEDQVAAVTAADEDVALSAITASELLHGVHRADSALRRARRETFIERILSSVPVLAFDLEVSRVHARIWADLRARGQPIGAHDLLIAATALHHEQRVATRDARSFHRVEGVSVVLW